MWLINVQTMEMEEFINPPTDKGYAILSHTWDEEEVSFAAYKECNFEQITSKGAQKIKNTCEQAKGHGLKYAWVDTCCIDKSSSAELSEAINSMFEWYSKAKICFAYLEDVARIANDPPSWKRKSDANVPIENKVNSNDYYDDDDSSEDDNYDDDYDIDYADSEEEEEDWSLSDGTFMKSRWFTRGWTLQELIAPRRIEFYGKDWKLLGSKSDLRELIYMRTKISPAVLENPNLRLNISLATRMSWASQRVTTRAEDIAYCLLGIFGVHMPLLYGEGQSRAFFRLQKEIVENTDDDTFLVFSRFNHELMADSPAKFKKSTDIISDHRIEAWLPKTGNNSISFVKGGLQLDAPVLDANSICNPKCTSLLHQKTGCYNFRMYDGLAILQSFRLHQPDRLLAIPLRSDDNWRSGTIAHDFQTLPTAYVEDIQYALRKTIEISSLEQRSISRVYIWAATKNLKFTPYFNHSFHSFIDSTHDTFWADAKTLLPEQTKVTFELEVREEIYGIAFVLGLKFDLIRGFWLFRIIPTEKGYPVDTWLTKYQERARDLYGTWTEGDSIDEASLELERYGWIDGPPRYSKRVANYWWLSSSESILEIIIRAEIVSDHGLNIGVYKRVFEQEDQQYAILARKKDAMPYQDVETFPS
jgi:Heterokaryon incompatibility protein (HET)